MAVVLPLFGELIVDGPVQTYVYGEVPPVKLPFRATEAFAHKADEPAEAVTTGALKLLLITTISVTLAVAVQPFASVNFTLYIYVPPAVGLAVVFWVVVDTNPLPVGVALHTKP